MLFQSPEPVSASDRVHARILTALSGVEIEGWRYVGYRVGNYQREPFYALRFEKGLLGRLAAADVKVKAVSLDEPFFPVSEFLASRLKAAEAGLIQSTAH